MLKAFLDKAGWATLSPETQALYVASGDGYRLNVDGMVLESEISGLKSNTAEALRDKKKAQDDLQALLAKIGGDPDKAVEALRRAQELDDQKMIDAGKLDELLTQRTERMRADHEAQIARLVEENDKLKERASNLTGRLATATIESGALAALTERGVDVHKAARALALAAANKTFKINDSGDPEARDEQGTLRYGKDPRTPYGFADFADEFIRDYGSDLWKDSGGGTRKTAAGLSGADWHKLSPTERLDAARAGGQQA